MSTVLHAYLGALRRILEGFGGDSESALGRRSRRNHRFSTRAEGIAHLLGFAMSKRARRKPPRKRKLVKVGRKCRAVPMWTHRLSPHSQRATLGIVPLEPKWWNWQTRRIQNPLAVRSCGFDSHLRYFRAGGETGRRKGLKIPRWEHHEGSIPSRSIDLNPGQVFRCRGPKSTQAILRECLC